MTEKLVLDGRYRLEHFFKGGFGVLWKARDLKADIWVAVKVLRDPAEVAEQAGTSVKSVEPGLKARFLRECVILREMRHPSIPAWLGQGYHDGSPYLVMEWIDGVSLCDFIKTYGALKPSVVASIVVQIAEALDCAHRHGVIHRDLNPNNVMITPRGVVHLIDFGIALPTDPSATRHTAPGYMSPNTPGYTSREQFWGGAVGPASDIYSLGCIVYELHTGSWPFHETPEGGLEYHHTSDRVAPPVAEGAPGLPPELARTVDRMLVKRVEGRLGSAEEVHAAYHPFLPAEGDPEPIPRMTHDPTLPFREPDRTSPAPPVRARGHRRSRGAHRDTPQLRTDEAQAALDAARRELSDGPGPGPDCAALEPVRRNAVRAWGLRTELAARIQLLCADVRLHHGDRAQPSDVRAALALCQELVAALDGQTATGLHEVFLSARLGEACCMWALGSDPTPAFDGWAAVATEAAVLTEPPEDPVLRCRELGERFIEASVRAERARALLARLPVTR
ncbi:serine/threonine protein kinase [Streptomyces inusitatus]|nr:serine/threonine-protein kinase [Streptomyces inusitatus]